MTQLTYQGAFDPFHTMFRLFRIAQMHSFEVAHPLDTVRIIDYFLSFPYRLEIFSFKQEHRSYRKISKEYEHLKPYGDRPDDWTLFGRMEQIQRASLSTLAYEGFIEMEAFIDGMVVFTEQGIPENLKCRTQELNSQNKQLTCLLTTLMSDYELTGNNGLKKRSTLMEHRYDSI